MRKYDLPMLVSCDNDVKDYISNIMSQLRKWIYGGRLLKLVLVIMNKATTEPVERWVFSVDIQSEGDGDVSEKPKEQMQREIQAIFRQITASVSYLPFLNDEEYTFNVLVYTDPSYDSRRIPSEWADTQGDGKLIVGEADSVNFSSFSTSNHQVGTSVSYKLG